MIAQDTEGKLIFTLALENYSACLIIDGNFSLLIEDNLHPSLKLVVGVIKAGIVYLLRHHYLEVINSG